MSAPISSRLGTTSGRRRYRIDKLLAPYIGKRVLVTGGCGYLAFSLVRALRAVGTSIIRLCRAGGTPAPSVPSGPGRIEVVLGDVRDPKVWSRTLPGVDFVFHLAAQTSVPRASQDPQADLEVNVRAMLHLLESCRRERHSPVVLFAGTATQSGIPSAVPVNETQPDAPVTIYDFHKLLAESYLKHYSVQGVVRGATLRLA